MRNEHKELMPYFSSFFPSFFEENENRLNAALENRGVSLSEDASHVYVEAAVPGIRPEEIEMTYEKGMLTIKAEKKEETSDKSKKFYRKAYQNFFYHIAVPGSLDETKSPEAICKDGILKVSFFKNHPESPRKKIAVKKG